jgi:hypothetical protein
MSLFEFLRRDTNEDRFAKKVMRRLRNRGWQTAIQYDPRRFAIVLAGGNGSTLLLGNAYRDWTRARGVEKSIQLDRATAFAFEPKTSDDFDEVAPRLLPAIRNRTDLENYWRHPLFATDRTHNAPVVKAFCDALVVGVAVDMPDSIRLVGANQLTTWSRSLDEVLPIAMENLRARNPTRFHRTEHGFYLSSYGDFYDPSRLLLPHVFECLPLRGDPVAVALSWLGMAVAGSEDLQALQAMADFVDEHISKDTRPLSYLPLVLRDREWQPLDCSGPNFAALDRLRVKQSLWDYGHQKTLLEGYFARKGRDVFVATLHALEHKDRIRTWAVWTGEAASLLPEADAIVVRWNGSSHCVVRDWGDIVEFCGPFRIEPGLYPRRYFVETGPGADT